MQGLVQEVFEKLGKVALRFVQISNSQQPSSRNDPAEELRKTQGWLHSVVCKLPTKYICTDTTADAPNEMEFKYDLKVKIAERSAQKSIALLCMCLHRDPSPVASFHTSV
jgi:hypothetical protein